MARGSPVTPTRILTQAQVERLLELPATVAVVRDAFKAQARGEVTMPSKVYLPLPHESDFRAMPAALARPPICGIKWVNVHPANRARGLPTVMALIILNDPATGVPLAVLDGLAITRLRTAAAAAVATEALALRTVRIGALIGCGAQALPQLQAMCLVRRLREVRVWGYADGEAAAFCRRARRHVAARLIPTDTIETAIRGAQVITTITPARDPLIERRWVAPGAHINAIGADAPGKQELDPQILRHAVLVVDEREQAIHGGEINVPISQGLLKPESVTLTLGDVLLRKQPGRTRPDQITVFDSTGLAVHDIALGAEVFRRAHARRVGRTIRFFAPPAV